MYQRVFVTWILSLFNDIIIEIKWEIKITGVYVNIKLYFFILFSEKKNIYKVIECQ